MTESEKRMRRVCFTGHRPEKLNMSERAVKKALRTEILSAIQDGMPIFISGMSRGVDIWAAEIVLELRKNNPDIKLICAIPFEGFEKFWSYDWKRKYLDILTKADFITYICKSYSNRAYQMRNQWMVDRARRVIAVFNGEESGTKNTVVYAEESGVEVRNIYRSSFF